MARALLAPLGGAFVAASLLYAFQASYQARNQHVIASLRASTDALRDVGGVDGAGKTEEQLREERRRQALRQSRYTPPSQPSLADEIKARWNEHLQGFARGLSEFDAEEFATRTVHVLRTAYARATGAPLPPPPSGLDTHLPGSPSGSRGGGVGDTVLAYLTEGVEKASSQLAPHAKATLRDPIPPRVDPRLHQPNTYYLGQGVSLRE